MQAGNGVPHCVGHLSLKELLGVEAEALAGAGAARAARPLCGLHPAGGSRAAECGNVSIRTGVRAGAGKQAGGQGCEAAAEAPRTAWLGLQCKAHPVTQSAEPHRLMGVTPRLSMPVRGLYSFCFTTPLSTTYTTPSTAVHACG